MTTFPSVLRPGYNARMGKRDQMMIGLILLTIAAVAGALAVENTQPTLRGALGFASGVTALAGIYSSIRGIRT